MAGYCWVRADTLNDITLVSLILHELINWARNSTQMACSWSSWEAEMWITPAIIFLWMWNKANKTPLVLTEYSLDTAYAFELSHLCPCATSFQIQQQKSTHMGYSWPSWEAKIWITPAIIFLWMWNKSNKTPLVMAGYSWVTAHTIGFSYLSLQVAPSISKKIRLKWHAHGPPEKQKCGLPLQSSFYECWISQTKLHW